MRAELGLPSVKGDEERGGGMMGGFGGSMGGVGGNSKAKRPISVKFEIPYFTTSGIQVRYLKIIEPKVCSHRPCCRRNNADLRIAAIPIAALGAIYHAEWRRHSQVAGCAIAVRNSDTPTLQYATSSTRRCAFQDIRPCQSPPYRHPQLAVLPSLFALGQAGHSSSSRMIAGTGRYLDCNILTT